MHLQIRRVGEALIVRLSGDLDLHTAGMFRQRVDEQLRTFPRLKKLVLNLGDVTFIDSAGLGALLGRLHHVQRRGGRLVAVGAGTRTRKLMEMSGLLKLIDLADDEPGALRMPAPKSVGGA